MAGYIYRNNCNNDEDDDDNNRITQQESSGWYVYRNEDNNKGFELWQQQQQQNDNYPTSSVVGLSGDEIISNRSESRDIMMMSGSGSGSGSGGSVSCQDCGNQAKKDCTYMRCRTCCKSRGFNCPTHIKSTWVPASVRRERHHKHAYASPSVGVAQVQEDEPGRQGEDDGQHKRIRRGSSSSSSLPVARSLSGMEEVGNFPAEVRSPAVFRCVRVSSIDDTADEYAYQTAVSIGGHIFKGILYDQGPDQHPHQLHQYQQLGNTSTSTYVGGETSSGCYDGSQHPVNTAGFPSSSTVVAASSPGTGFIDPSLYPVTLISSYMLSPGTQFFPNPRP